MASKIDFRSPFAPRLPSTPKCVRAAAGSRRQRTPAVCAQEPEGITKSTSAALHLQNALRQVPAAAPMRYEYGTLRESYCKQEKRLWDPPCPRKAREAAVSARDSLLSMQKMAERLAQDFQPVMAERRHSVESRKEVALVEAARAASVQHGARLRALALELLFMQPATADI